MSTPTGQPTPGPWKLAQHGGKWFVQDATPPDDKGRFVGQVIAWETTCPDSPANLRVIAAAPDFYEVAKDFVRWLETGGLSGSDRDMFVARFKAAIAKAEGRTP